MNKIRFSNIHNPDKWPNGIQEGIEMELHPNIKKFKDRQRESETMITINDKKMTREEFETKWQSLTPRERNAWVAEDVMGDKPTIIWIATTDGGKSAFYDSESKSDVERFLKEIKKKFPDGWSAKGEVSYLKIYKTYTEDISSAMEVVDKMKTGLFSQRKKFLNCLQESTRIDEKSVVAWPDVFWFITPEAICKASLICKVVE